MKMQRKGTISKKTIRFRALAFALTVLLAGVMCAFPVHASGSGNTKVSDVRNGVVVVEEYGTGKLQLVDENGYVLGEQSYEGGIASGTGFFVGEKGKDPQYLLTNHHVVADFLAGGNGQGTIQLPVDTNLYFKGIITLRVYYSEEDYDDIYVVDHLDMNTDADCALLRLNHPTDQRKPLTLMSLGPNDDLTGQTVYVVGFPGISENQFTGASSNKAEDATVNTGTVSKMVTEAGSGVNRIQTDALISHGNSGGPLVTADGYVIGMATNHWVDDSKAENARVNYAVNIRHAISLLDKNNVPYMTASGKGGNVLLIVGIVIAVIAVAAVAAVIVLKKKGSKAEPKKATAAAGSVAGAGKASAGTASAGQPARAKGPIARSLASQHNGLSVSVGTAPILVGRDRTKCAIAYAEGTAGVSGRHCSIAFDLSAQSFVVTDLGSTYGTFLMNGQRLQANVPCRLRVGDSFYVGDKANVIRLELG